MGPLRRKQSSKMMLVSSEEDDKEMREIVSVFSGHLGDALQEEKRTPLEQIRSSTRLSSGRSSVVREPTQRKSSAKVRAPQNALNVPKIKNKTNLRD